jgi:hypothetical protein
MTRRDKNQSFARHSTWKHEEHPASLRGVMFPQFEIEEEISERRPADILARSQGFCIPF